MFPNLHIGMPVAPHLPLRQPMTKLRLPGLQLPAARVSLCSRRLRRAVSSYVPQFITIEAKRGRRICDDDRDENHDPLYGGVARTDLRGSPAVSVRT